MVFNYVTSNFSAPLRAQESYLQGGGRSRTSLPLALATVGGHLELDLANMTEVRPVQSRLLQLLQGWMCVRGYGWYLLDNVYLVTVVTKD